jgi:hypothetical protein
MGQVYEILFEIKHRVTLTAGPMAPGIARGQVRATIAAWDIPVYTSVAILLTSELVTNAVMHETGESITLVIACGYGQLGVDVHDTSTELPCRWTGRRARRPGGAWC